LFWLLISGASWKYVLAELVFRLGDVWQTEILLTRQPPKALAVVHSQSPRAHPAVAYRAPAAVGADDPIVGPSGFTVDPIDLPASSGFRHIVENAMLEKRKIPQMISKRRL